MFLPYSVLVDTVFKSPLFGAGVGGKEVVADARNMAAISSTRVIGNNALASIVIFLGVIGGGLFVYFVLAHMRHTGVRQIGLLVVLLVMFSQLMGGIDTFRYWGFVSLIWGALAASNVAADLGTPAAEPFPLAQVGR
jgi:hypothetical protein